MDELISQAADFISSLLPFLNNINIVGLILSFVSLVLSVLLCFWGYRLFTCFTGHRLCNRRLFRIFTVWSLFYRRVMDYSFKCTDSWSYTWLFGNQANSFVHIFCRLNSCFSLFMRSSGFICPFTFKRDGRHNQLDSWNCRWCDLYKTAKTYHNSRHCLLRCTRHGTNFISAFKI